MKLHRSLSTLTVIIAAVIVTSWVKTKWFTDSTTTVNSMAPTLEKIQTLSSLVTNKIFVSDIIDADNKDYEGKWVINGDALLTTDLSMAKLDLVNEETKTAVITLPLPQVTSPRVDHERTKKISIKGKGFPLLRNTKNKEKMEQYINEVAQKSIATYAGRPEMIENAKAQAELIISNIYLKVGWEVTILWDSNQQSTNNSQVAL